MNMGNNIRMNFIPTLIILTFTFVLLLTAASAAASSQPHPHFLFPSLRCTTIVVGHSASTPGSGALTTHTNDCKDCDFRLARIPRRPKFEKSRNVYPARFSYPRFVGDERGKLFAPELVDRSIFDWPNSKPIGSIRSVSPTFAYFDGVYGLLNERGVSMGESTCAGRFVSRPIFAGGTALFEISELNRVALERASTAREAIKIMGSLAEEYGFYGSEWEGEFAQGEAGEALSIADLTETWIFHILPDDTGKSAIWVAQRVPDDEIAVVANAFTIGAINVSDSKNFLASSNIYEIAIRQNLWQPNTGLEFHFSFIYGAKIAFESYCARRQWRVFSLVAPSLNLLPTDRVADLPFSVRPDNRLSPSDVMKIQRDHYEGTEFDLTTGIAAGPFGNPNRYDRGVESASMGILFQGTFERPIAMFRTAYSSIAQSRPGLPAPLSARLLFASASPHGAAYAPFYPAMESVPRPFSVGSLYSLTRDSIWWSGTAVSNYAERMWDKIHPDINAAQLEEENRQLTEFGILEAELTPMFESANSSLHSIAMSKLSAFTDNNAVQLNVRWWNLFDQLITKYHDGYQFNDFATDSIEPTPVFYPLKWLEAVNFFPTAVDWAAKSFSILRFSESDNLVLSAATSSIETPQSSGSNSIGRRTAVYFLSLTALISLAIGFRFGFQKGKRDQYAPLEQ